MSTKKKRLTPEQKAERTAKWDALQHKLDYCEAAGKLAYNRAHHAAWVEYERLEALGIKPVINRRPWEAKAISTDDQKYLKEMGITY